MIEHLRIESENNQQATSKFLETISAMPPPTGTGRLKTSSLLSYYSTTVRYVLFLMFVFYLFFVVKEDRCKFM